MEEENWDDDSSQPTAVVSDVWSNGARSSGTSGTSSQRGGRSFGRGREFTPILDEDEGNFSNSGNYGRSRGVGGGFGDRRRGNDGGNFNRFKSRNDAGGINEYGGDRPKFNDRYKSQSGAGGRNEDGGFRARFNNDRFKSKSGDADNEDSAGGDGEKKEDRPPPYIPPEPSNDENVLFESGISAGINFDKYNDIEVHVEGNDVPEPVLSFQESGLSSLILENLKKANFRVPTPIQKYAIPTILNSRDLMATAQTGSGKTGAFVLPIIHALMRDSKDLVVGDHCEPQALIISPTRELAIQINNVVRKFCYGSFIKHNVVYGGTSVGYQARNILRGCHILTSTPGRLMQYVNQNTISFASLKFVVLDEADRMLDLGFRGDIENVFNHPTISSRENRQTLMFSATFSADIKRLAVNYLQNYIYLAVGIVGGACTDVLQVFYQLDSREKRPKLKEILKTEGSKGTLVFIETKRSADFIAAFLSDIGIPTTSIHGDRYQHQREEALSTFRTGKMDVLVATAVAARGLDIEGVRHVINYDMPKTVDEYVHRIGRTGRVGNCGKASSFFDLRQDTNLADDLKKILRESGQQVPDWM